MKKLILFTVLLQSIGPSQLWGQNIKSIHGKIIDKTGEPLTGATVFIKGTTKGTTSDIDGTFQVDIQNEMDTLRFSFIGYISQDVIPQDNMLITLQPDETQIDEVVVSAQRLTIQVEAYKTTVFPALSPITSSGTAYSVLKNIPGVIVNSDGTIYLNGRSGVKILVDGKSSQLSDTDLVNYLMSLPATSLNKIELIDHPSVKYEASGNAGIIDICTIKNNEIGYNFNINTNFEQGIYGRSNNNISFRYYKTKLNFNGMLGNYLGEDYVDLTTNREYPESVTVPITYFNQDSYRKRKSTNQYFTIGLDYFVSDKKTIGINVRGNSSNRIENGSINSIFYTLITQCDSTIYSTTNNEQNNKNLISNIYIQHKIDSLGKEISASVDGLFYAIGEDQFHKDVFHRPSENSSESISKTRKYGSINMHSERIELAYPINKNLRIDVGIRSDFVNIHNASDYKNNINSEWIIDSSLSTSFLYQENINALYASSKLQRNALTIEAGFRIENTNFESDSSSQSYTNFFPNLIMSWQLFNQNALNFIYDRRITRPNYKDLNPFVYVFDSYTYEQGNTELKPQFTNRFNLSYTIRKTYKIALFYTHTKQAIIKSYIVEEGSNRVWVMPTNMSSFYSYGIQGDVGNLSFVNWLNSGIHYELVQNNYKWSENGSTITNNGFTFQIGVQNRIKLPWKLTGEISGFYNSRMAYGQIDVLPIWQISGGIQCNFFNDNATFNIFSNDWFHSNKTRAEGIICGSKVCTQEFTDNTIIGVSFSYRFKKGLDVENIKGKKEINTKRISL